MSLRRYPRWVLRERGDANRLRAIWRVLIPLVLTFGIGGIALPLLLLQVVSLPAAPLTIVSNVLLATAFGGTLIISAYYLDRRPIRSYGFRLSPTWWGEFVAGSILGVGLIAITFSLSYSLGWVSVVEVWSAGDVDSFLGWFVLFAVGWLCVGFWEETLFRGIFITNATEGLSTFHTSPRRALFEAWGVSTVAFGLLHAPLGTVPGDASLVGMLVVWTMLGGLLGLSYVLSGELAFPIGLHFALNYAANNVFFGVEPPGGPAFPTVIRPELTAPELWHPIGGLTMIPGVIVGYVSVCGWFYWRRGELSVSMNMAAQRS